MKLKSIVAIAALLVAGMTASAQGFAKFTVEGALTATHLKHNTNVPSVIEAIVGPEVDITNIPAKYKLLSSCSFSAETPYDADFTKVHRFVIEKKDGTSKEWNVIVHQLVAAPLPLDLCFSKANPCSLDFTNPKPWAGYGLDYTKPTVARMGNDGVGFFVAFADQAKDVTFDLTAVGKDAFKGELDVETSADGLKWKNLKTYKPGSFTATETFTLDLPADARFVRWVYAVREERQNINVNNIHIK